MPSGCEYPPHEIPHCGIAELSHVIFHLFRPISLIGPQAVDALSDFRISTGEGKFHIFPSLAKRLCLFTGRVFLKRGLHVVEQVEPVPACFVPRLRGPLRMMFFDPGKGFRAVILLSPIIVTLHFDHRDDFFQNLGIRTPTRGKRLLGFANGLNCAVEHLTFCLPA